MASAHLKRSESTVDFDTVIPPVRQRYKIAFVASEMLGKSPLPRYSR